MRRWSERQLKVVIADLDNQWNKPDRHDHYLMQIAASNSGKKNPKLGDFQIPFELVKPDERTAKRTPAQLKAYCDRSRAGWEMVKANIGPRPNESPAAFQARLKKMKEREDARRQAESANAKEHAGGT